MRAAAFLSFLLLTVTSVIQGSGSLPIWNLREIFLSSNRSGVVTRLSTHMHRIRFPLTAEQSPAKVNMKNVIPWIRERLIRKRVSALESSQGFSVAESVDRLVALAREYDRLQPADAHWECLGQEDDITVWRLKTPYPSAVMSHLRNGSHSQSGDEDWQWPCVRSVTTVDISVDELCNAIVNSTLAARVNKYSAGRDDVQVIDRDTKIVWSRTRIPLAMKAYDFCTLMHVSRNAEDGSTTILSSAVRSPRVPVSTDFARSEVIFGLSRLSPTQNSNRTQLTSISHVRYAGTLPFVASRSAFQGAVSYFKSLKSTIQDMENA